MPRPPIERGWREAIFSIVANPTPNERLTDQSIVRRLREVAPRIGRTDVPSPRSVGRIRKEFGELDEEDRRDYYRFHWPASMEDGSLPWEASAAALELLRMPTKSRPTISLVKWFYRLTLAVPDAPVEDRKNRAIFLAMNEAADSPSPRAKETVEGWMIYQPWTSADAELEYQEAILAAVVPDEQIPIASMDTIELGFWDSGPGAHDELRDYLESKVEQAQQEEGDTQ